MELVQDFFQAHFKGHFTSVLACPTISKTLKSRESQQSILLCSVVYCRIKIYALQLTPFTSQTLFLAFTPVLFYNFTMAMEIFGKKILDARHG